MPGTKTCDLTQINGLPCHYHIRNTRNAGDKGRDRNTGVLEGVVGREDAINAPLSIVLKGGHGQLNELVRIRVQAGGLGVEIDPNMLLSTVSPWHWSTGLKPRITL